jgi:O-antigen ligase
MLGTISNYSASSFLIKSGAGVIIILFIVLNERSINKNLLNRTSNFDFTKAVKIISFLIVLPALTLFYSANLQFGLLKILNMILSSVFPAALLFYLIIDFNELRMKLISIIVLTGAVISVVSILIVNPFYYDQVYDLMTFHWSHVFFGRFLGLAFLTSMIFTIDYGKGKGKLLFYFITLFIAFGLIITGLRSAISGVVVSSFMLIIAGIFSKQLNYQKVLLIISILLVSVLLFFIASNWQGNIKTRVNDLVETFQLKSSEDDAIQSRIEGYDLALERISESPITGAGFGGYKSVYNDNNIGLIISYPHNIFLEAFVELGIGGLLLVVLLILFILKRSYAVSYKLFALIFFSVWLAQFSKDIPSQTTLWAGIAFIVSKKNNQSG